MYVKKSKLTVNEQAQQEYINSRIAKQKALIEYIAMMSDVDLPEESEGISDE